MVDRAPESKRDEQYPLLKVDSGGGDGTRALPAANLVTSRSSVAYSPKQSWLVRWPEYMSACWMTTILLGISFLVFYAMAMSAYRHQSIIVIKCNSSKPASEVYLHHIIQPSGCVPFALYSEYLSYMAAQYPYLNFNVFFLIDDSIQSPIRGLRNNRFINKFIAYHPSSIFNIKLDVINKQQIRDFQRRYQNVNVTITPLSKYMAMTPLRFKWRTIPVSYLPFYARTYSIWQTGGIGIDLTTFNNYYNTHQRIDRRISAILKQHNDGIKPDVYAKTLKNIDRDEENEFLSMFYGIAQQFLNETRSILNKTLSYSQVLPEKSLPLHEPLIRTHRNKREVTKYTTNSDSLNNKNNTVSVDFVNATHENLTDSQKKNRYQYHIISEPIKDNIINSSEVSVTQSPSNTSALNKSLSLDSNITEAPQVVFFYDVTFFFDSLAPSISWPEALWQSNSEQGIKKSELSSPSKRAVVSPQLLSIESEGLFVSVSSRLHPFLGHLISAGCQRMHPKLAIQDALLTQCSSIFRNDVYCNNIYIL